MKLRSLLLLGLFSFATLAVAQPIRVVGSDLLTGNVGLELARFGKVSDLQMDVSLRGSRLGLAALRDGAADFGLFVFGTQDTMPGPEFSTLPVGYFTAVVLAPAGVSISQIHFRQLAGVFGASEAQTFSRWGDIGVTGPWSSRGITAMGARRAGLALDLFRYEVMSAPELKSTVVLFDELDRLYGRLNGSEGGIAIVATPPVGNPNVKVLLVAKAERDVAYGPTAENLHSGDYPLRLPLYLVFRKGDARRLNFVLRHLLSDEVRPVFLQAGVIPLPVQARNQLVFDLENR
jgi:phosphate transport system substrate-binding protein